MRIHKAIAVACMLMLWGSGTVQAAAITVDGNAADWQFNYGAGGGYVASDRFNYTQAGTTASGVSYVEEAGVGSLGYLGPGYGGAPFDIKGLYFTSDADNFYIAAVVGMGPGGTYNGGRRYVMGDILITDASNNLYGIVTNGTDRAPNPAFTAGAFGEVTAANINDPGFAASNPCFVAGFTDGAGTTPLYYTNLGTNLWFIETSVSRALFSAPIAGIHLTESSGSDELDLASPYVPAPEPSTLIASRFVQVSEPGTLLLLGSGLLGMAVYGRRQRRG